MFNQWDSKWGSKPLGNPKYNLNMGNSGCYVTTVAMGLKSFFIKDLDPGRLRDQLAANGGFSDDGQLSWATLAKLFPGTELIGSSWTTNVPGNNLVRITPDKAIKDIRSANLKGQVVGICVDLVKGNPRDPDHIVLAVETPATGEWIVADPDGGLLGPFSKRYGPKETGIKGYRIFAGQPANYPDESTISDKQGGTAIGFALDPRYTKRDILAALLSA